MPEIERAPAVESGGAEPVGEEPDRLQVEQRFAMVPGVRPLGWWK